MPCSERIIGFSTGAIAKGDFVRALDLLKNAHVPAVELSALREHELPELVNSLKDMDLSSFAYVSVHAPSNFKDLSEKGVVHLLGSAVSMRIPIVVHPDTIQSPHLWRSFGCLLLVENMDKRKPVGRTTSELQRVFENLPEAGFCFDVAHSRQVDPTMIESAQMLREFQGRLREVHASGVTARSSHGLISAAAQSAYGRIAHLIPENVPIILESPVDALMIRDEIAFARTAFSPWFQRLCTDIDHVLDMKTETLRRGQAERFLKILQMTRIRLSDFEQVISQLPTGWSFTAGDVFLTPSDLLGKLSEQQKSQLKQYLTSRVKELAREYPDLRSEFREQFSSLE
jgi:hypothetical protein